MAFSNLHAPPITAAFWDAVVARLATPALAALTRGPGRVYLEGTYSGDPAPPDTIWGRVVVVPALTLWPVEWRPGSATRAPFVIRTDWNDVRDAGYNPTREMEAAQRLAFEQLQHWVPTGLAGLEVAFPVYLARSWQQRALRDPGAGHLYLSAEYRTELVSA